MRTNTETAVQRVAVVGSGYVGTTVAACFAAVGHQVVGVEVDHHKLRSLRSGRAPFHEPRVDELLGSGLGQGNLRFTDSILDAMSCSDVVFLCVGAPMSADGRPDMRALDGAARAIGGAITSQVVVNKSTIPVGGAQWLASIVADGRPQGGRSQTVPLVSNPEFLREGTAVDDFLYPHRVVLGSDDEAALGAVARVYAPILSQSFPGGDPACRPVLIRTSPQTAEVIKFAANAFLATKISFINEMANICERVGADVSGVASAMGLDPRIGPHFLRAGIGWGGSCLAKDLSELIATAEQSDYQPDLLKATMSVNRHQRGLVVKKLAERLRVLQGRRVCLLGLAFKPLTDDVRDAPGVEIARRLLEKGALVTAHDPAVSQLPGLPDLGLVDDPYQAAEEADATVLVTDWPEFLTLDYAALRRRMRGDLFIDGRNALDPVAMLSSGFRYENIGGAGGADVDLRVVEGAPSLAASLADDVPFGPTSGPQRCIASIGSSEHGSQ